MSIKPWYNTNANYQTNAKSIVDYLARSNKFLEMMVEDYEVFQELIVAEMKQAKFDAEIAVDDILVKWLEDGTLARIINDGVLGNKADKEWTIEQLDNLTESMDNNVTIQNEKIETNSLKIDTNENDINEQRINLMNLKKDLSVINVKTFGAIGDGIADDTAAIQNAINSINKQRQTIIFPPTNGGFYKVSELTIPKSAEVSTLTGIGDARIYFTGNVGFHILAEFIQFSNLTFLNIKGQNEGTNGTILFKDERAYNRLDFDLYVKDCIFNYWQDIVQTVGRGVNIDYCDFNNITRHAINLTVLNKELVSVGTEDIHQYETGYRGYVIQNSRFHYCTQLTIMKTTNDTHKIVQGVQIINNQIEGGLGYYNGYLRNSIIANNNHYQADTSSPLFYLDGAEDTKIELHVIGMNSWKDKYPKFIHRIVEAHGELVNVRITGLVQGLKFNAITLYQGASLLTIDLQVRHVLGVDYTPSFLVMGGDKNYNGIHVKGFFDSKSAETVGILKEGTGTLNNLKYDEFTIIGNYQKIAELGDYTP